METSVALRDLHSLTQCLAVVGFLEACVTTVTQKRNKVKDQDVKDVLDAQMSLFTDIADRLRSELRQPWQPEALEDTLYELQRATENAIFNDSGSSTFGHSLGYLVAAAYGTMTRSHDRKVKSFRRKTPNDPPLAELLAFTPETRRALYRPQDGYEWMHAIPLDFAAVASAVWDPVAEKQTAFYDSKFLSVIDEKRRNAEEAAAAEATAEDGGGKKRPKTV